MITNGRVRDKEPNVTASFAELAHDVIELTELQAQLFALDVKETAQKTRTSIILTVIGASVLLGSIPVALFALAEVFVEQLGWSQAAGFGVATLVGLVVALAILAAGWLRFKSGMNTLQRSREELSRNIAWIKSSLRTRPATARDKEAAAHGAVRTGPK